MKELWHSIRKIFDDNVEYKHLDGCSNAIELMAQYITDNYVSREEVETILTYLEGSSCECGVSLQDTDAADACRDALHIKRDKPKSGTDELCATCEVNPCVCDNEKCEIDGVFISTTEHNRLKEIERQHKYLNECLGEKFNKPCGCYPAESKIEMTGEQFKQYHLEQNDKALKATCEHEWIYDDRENCFSMKAVCRKCGIDKPTIPALSETTRTIKHFREGQELPKNATFLFGFINKLGAFHAYEIDYLKAREVK